MQKRCKTWADAGECDKNPGFMTNNCKVACKRCKLPVGKNASKMVSGKASPTLVSQAAGTVQKGAAVASEAAGKVLDSGKEAVTSLVTNTTSLVKNTTSGANGTCHAPLSSVTIIIVVIVISNDDGNGNSTNSSDQDN